MATTLTKKKDAVTSEINIARDAFGHLVQGISVFNNDLSLVFFNDRLSELLDFPEDLIQVGTNLAELFRYNATRGEYGPGEVETQVRERIELAKQFRAHSFQRERPNGSIIKIDGNPIPSGGFVTTYTDITEKVQYEAFLKSIIEASPAGFGVARQSDGKLSYLNTRLAEMFHTPVHQMMGFQAENIYADAGELEAILQQIREQGSVRDYQARFKRHDDSEFPGLISLYPTTYQNEPSLFAWIYDISNLKQAQEHQSELERELNQAHKLEAIGQLAGGIAHEINTPSQYVWDNLKFLLEAQREVYDLLDDCLALIGSVADDHSLGRGHDKISQKKEAIDLEYLREEVPAAIEQSIKGISDISRIVLAMKEFSHPGEGNRSTVDINHMLENTLTISHGEWKHTATIETELDPALPPIHCNPGEINQVFLNLLVNAAHAIDECTADRPGRITIKTRRQDKLVEIQIRDNGNGIPDEIREKIFEPFFTTKEVGKGTGQGLPIVRNIVLKKHGGDISFTTEKGEGTSFTISLPIQGAEHAERA